MPLAAFPLIMRRWQRSILFSGHYAQYQQLREYLPEEIFLTRIDTLEQHILKEYPHVWIDTTLFTAAILFVVLAAVFSIVARAANLSLWYPLIILIVPAFIAYYTTKRRNVYYHKLSKYYESLQSVLKEMNSLDVTRQIKWSFRRLRDTDTADSMHLLRPIQQYNINFVVQVIQIDIENELAEEGEVLPAYDTSMMDVVLDVGPEIEQIPGNQSSYIVTSSPQSVTTGGRRMVLSHPLPPAYERPEEVTQEEEEEEEVIEMEPVLPPPAYINDSTLPTANTTTTTTLPTPISNNIR